MLSFLLERHTGENSVAVDVSADEMARLFTDGEEVSIFECGAKHRLRSGLNVGAYLEKVLRPRLEHCGRVQREAESTSGGGEFGVGELSDVHSARFRVFRVDHGNRKTVGVHKLAVVDHNIHERLVKLLRFEFRRGHEREKEGALAAGDGLAMRKEIRSRGDSQKTVATAMGLRSHETERSEHEKQNVRSDASPFHHRSPCVE